MLLPDVDLLFDTLAGRIAAYLSEYRDAPPKLIGIHTGGVWLAERLRQRLELTDPIGTLDISFYRDDLGARGLQPSVHPSRIPFDIEGQRVLLVDDILYTGRTVRAALNELFDYGRPAAITLAALISRNGRELPIQADLVGAELELPPGVLIKLRGPDPLRLELREIPALASTGGS